jgi:LmbE family N-acetylglucosaminyl deacetylase
VFHYIQWKELNPDFVVDITGFIDKKVESVLAYESQFYNEKSSEPSTPISNLNFLESVTYRAKNLGRIAGVEYAEGFTKANFPAVDSIFDII